MNMPLTYINALYRIAEERNKSQEGRAESEAEQMEDAIEEAVMG